MMRLVLIIITIMIELSAFEQHRIEPDAIKNGDYMGIEILDSKVIESRSFKGLKFCEISDIAYDSKRDLFYALSDKGVLFKVKIGIKDSKIESFKVIDAVALTGSKGKSLHGPYRDSESLALVGESLLVSFERRARLILYSKEIRFKTSIQLPKELRNIKNYRGSNYALESLTYTKEHGYLTAAEFPLVHPKSHYHDIYNKDGKLCAIKEADRESAITEMEMMPDGSLLLLLRKFKLFSLSFETSLLKVEIQNVENGFCKAEVLAWMSTKEGWHIDNFEGLTYLYDNIYIMVSDNNNNIFEKTIVTLFKIKEKK